jgi:hypothetical protein
MERVTVVYEIEISVSEDSPAPTEEEIAKAIYRGVDVIDSEDAVFVQRA